MANKKITKFILGLLIISMIMPATFFSAPKKTNAFLGFGDIVFDPTTYVPTWMQQVWGGLTSTATQLTAYFESHKFANWILENVLKRIAKALLAKMTQSIINWINSDFHGSPLFIQNPRSFFKDIAKSEIRNLIDMIGYDTFKFPFGPQTALNVINSYKSQLATNAQYSLSKVINDPDLLVRYRNDFNYGGWNGFLVNTQYPQNNYLGFQGIIQQNLASRLEGIFVAPAQTIKENLQQGMGFLSPQNCPTNPKYNNGVNEFLKPSFKSKIKYNFTSSIPPVPLNEDGGEDASDAYRSYQIQVEEEEARYTAEFQENQDEEQARWNEENTCPGGLVSTTPGAVAANQVFSALNVPFLSTALDGALGNALGAIFDALINHFIDKGLTGIADTISPPPSNDNWTYNGNSLSGGSVSNNGSDPLNIPQNVSVTVGQTTSIIISGGIIPYSIQTPSSAGIARSEISVSGTAGPKLAVTGVTSGQTFVVVKDSSTPVKTVAVQISVNALGALVVSPRNVLTDINNPVTVTISGGEAPYNMMYDTNRAIALAVFADTTLVVSGIQSGETSFTIRDSSVPAKIITVPIVITGTGDLVIPQNISTNVNQTINTQISGGMPPYSIRQIESPSLVNVQISGNTITTKGLSSGQTTMIVKDSSLPTKSAVVNITVTNIQMLQVAPSDVFANVGQIINTSISGGTPPYSILTPSNATIANSQIWNSSILINGVSSGQTYVVVKDSSVPDPQTINVPITIGALTVTPQNVTTTVNQAVNVTISGGTWPYRISTSPTTGVATAQILTNANNQQQTSATIAVTGRSRGQTSMIVSDSSTPAKTTGVQITVN